jgi:hypothetical protein
MASATWAEASIVMSERAAPMIRLSGGIWPAQKRR